MSITAFLNSKGFTHFEGYCQLCQPQVEDLILITKDEKLNMMEIGFNAGHSAETFLKNNPDITLTSFDLGEHNYGSFAKEFIDSEFPNRHTLILGDSRITVPKFAEENPAVKFDIIFIDGGHDYDIVKCDIANCLRLAHKDTVVIMDDTVYRKDWWEYDFTIGPTRIWSEYLEQNKIVEIDRKEYSPGHGMSWGKYVIES